MEIALEVQNLTVAYDRKPVLRGVSFTCPTGRVVGVVGPNGAGKSTLFKAVLGLLPAAAGPVRVFGEPLRKQRHRLAYLPQREAVDWDFPATVWDVVMMGRVRRIGWLRWPGRVDRERVHASLSEVGMEKLALRPIGQLSGGQQQRVFLARALAQEADLLLLDEPLVGVDAATEEVVHETVARLRGEGRTIFVIDHDLSRVERYDLVALVNGRLVAFGAPADVFDAENLRRTYGGRLVLLERVEQGRERIV